MSAGNADVWVARADQLGELAAHNDIAAFYVEIGHAKRLGVDHVFSGAEVLAGVLALAGRPGQTAKVTVLVDGFEDDPRELFQIPQAKRFIVQVMDELGIRSIENPDVRLFDRNTFGLLSACEVFGPAPPIFIVPKVKA